MNKKFIANSMNILFDKLNSCRDKVIINQVSAYLMLAVYKMFRLIYTAAPRNEQSLFSVSAGRWEGYSDAAMKTCEADLKAALQGEDMGEGTVPFKDPSCFAMTTETLMREYPAFANSLLNLIKTSEKHIENK